jgi:hypothetical protein
VIFWPCVYDQFHHQRVGQLIIISDRNSGYPCQNRLYLLEDVLTLILIDLANHLMIINGLADQFLHALNEGGVSALGHKLGDEFVIVQKFRAESQARKFGHKSINRIC